MAYERKQYAVAIDLLEAEYEKDNNTNAKGRKSFLLGQSYLQLLEYKEAKSWFLKSIQHNYGVESMAMLARVQINLEEYNEAITTYKKVGEITGRSQESERDIQICRNAILMVNDPKKVIVEKIIENTSVSEYSPMIYDNQFLVFTSERKEATGKNIYNWTGEKHADLFIMMKNGSEVRPFDSNINTEANEGNACFSKDMNTMYFTRCYSFDNGDDFCKIMVSKKIDGFWSEPEVLPFIQEKINYGHPALIEDDKILVFSADIEVPGDSKDLYYTEMLEDESWANPEKLPATINSQGNEKFPTGDGDTLYFSSDYWPGLGGFDIFKTYLSKDGKWTSPINMGYPINSGADDFSYIVDKNAKPKAEVLREGFLVSSRQGVGKDDIYRFYEIAPPKISKDTTTIIKEKKVFVTVKTYTPVFQTSDDPNSGKTGRMALGNVLIKAITKDAQKLSETYTDVNGFFYIEVPLNKDITFTGAKLNYLNSSKTISTSNIDFGESDSKTLNLELELEKIYIDREINLDNIYYDYDKWDIKAEAKPTLDKLVQLLNDNPQINIQLSSHTDCRGEDLYNETLSQKRAQSAVEYLISKGIQPERLVAKGYGESLLTITCICEQCSEEQHQANRRTTFKILKR